MRPFTFAQASSAEAAVSAAAVQGSSYIAGGTTLLDLMKLDVMRPARLVDVTPLEGEHGRVQATASGLRLGALMRMSEAAEHALIKRDYPVVAQSLTLAASQQLRNMATLGGNVLQRTRCPY